MRLLIAGLLFIPLSFGQFYIKDQQYRYPRQPKRTEEEQKRESPTEKQARAACNDHGFCSYEESQLPDRRDFSVNFVEFKDSGEPWDPSQLKDALTKIKNAKNLKSGGKPQKPLIFIYVHGWHNNADERENPDSRFCPDLKGDVAKFRDCGLKLLAQDNYPRDEGSPPGVVGIYLAWHGTDFGPGSGGLPYIVPSYMLRRYAANHVGNTGVCEAVGNILQTIQKEGRDNYVVALMGHSFGARVLENALKTIDPDPNRKCEAHSRKLAALKTTASSAGDQGALLPADLIFYVNAAAPNSFTASTIHNWNKHCESPSDPLCSANPFYVSVSSVSDLATRIVMPVANTAFIWWPVSLKPLRWEVTPFAAAHSFWMRTHRVVNRRTSPCFPTPIPNPNNRCFEVPIASHGMLTYTENYEIEPRKNVPKRFWVMHVGKYFSANHGDVWNPKIFELVRAFIPSAMKEEDRLRKLRGDPAPPPPPPPPRAPMSRDAK